jgi:hypothetical protein
MDSLALTYRRSTKEYGRNVRQFYQQKLLNNLTKDTFLSVAFLGIFTLRVVFAAKAFSLFLIIVG